MVDCLVEVGEGVDLVVSCFNFGGNSVDGLCIGVFE